ncbi:MAG: hypothetical protein AAFV93_09215, partial [Chloroflexota bacterium]
MSNEQENNIRRFGRKNQKDRLPKTGSLFPLEEDDLIESDERVEASDETEAPPSEFDINSLNLPDTDTEALAMLSSLRDEVKAPVITPNVERYPPVAPVTPPTEISSESKVVVINETPPLLAFVYNMFSILFLIATALVFVWFAFVWDDPQSVWNPFPPPTPFVVATVLPNQANIDAETLPTPDAEGQIFVVITDTPVPTEASSPSPFPFVSNPVLYVPNTNELGCNWWSIAGTVTDLDSNPIAGYRIKIIGEDVDETVFSGASQAFGAGGFELPLIGTPQEAS